jgi:hypothetical protein
VSGGVLVPTVQVLDVVTDEDLPFRVVRIPGGTAHPVTPARAHTETMVEFYLRTYPQAEPKVGGRFLGGMFQTTLTEERNTAQPLVLDPWMPWWRIDVDTMALVCRWLRSLDKAEQGQRWYVVDTITGKRLAPHGYDRYHSAAMVCAASNVGLSDPRFIVQDQNGNRERKQP